MDQQLKQYCLRYFRKFIVILSVPFLMIISSAVQAEEYGRCRAIVIHEDSRSSQSGSFSPKVFIIDSKEGHMWTWEQKTKIKDLLHTVTDAEFISSLFLSRARC